MHTVHVVAGLFAVGAVIVALISWVLFGDDPCYDPFE